MPEEEEEEEKQQQVQMTARLTKQLPLRGLPKGSLTQGASLMTDITDKGSTTELEVDYSLRRIRSNYG